MAKITAIKRQEKNKGRVNLYIDDSFAVGISEKLLIDLDLFKGKELNNKDIEKIKDAENISKCLDKAYRFLSFRPRSEAEIQIKLSEKFPEKTVRQAIDYLKKLNYLNDAEFCNFWIENRASGRGRRALYFELQKKGIKKEIIENSLKKIDKEAELESALLLVKSKRKYEGLSPDEAYKKIGGFLSRRGYSYETIKKVIKMI